MGARLMFLSPIRLGCWPAADQALWRKALEDDPLQPGGTGGAAGWRPSTTQMTMTNYGVWLAFLEREGLLGPSQTPADRVTLEVLRRYLDAMRWSGYAENTCSTRLAHLSLALCAMVPDFDATLIGRAAGRITRAATRARPIHQRCRNPADILDFAYGLMKRAEAADGSSRDPAIDFRDGLLFALLIHRPLRIANLAAIEVDRHLTRLGEGFWIQFEGAETKRHKPFGCDVPRALVPALLRYLTEYRPLLQRRSQHIATSKRLWISALGTPMTKGSVTQIIRRRTLRAFGIGMGPHLARHIAATTLAERAPDKVGNVAVILGHQSYESSERHYIHANAAEATRSLENALVAIAATPLL